MAESINWATMAFLLESGIFLFMGLQLKTLLDADDASGLSSGTALWVGLVASLVVIVLRMVYVAPLVAGMRRDADRAAAIKPRLADMETRVNDPRMGERLTGRRMDQFLHRLTRKRSDFEFYVAEGSAGEAESCWLVGDARRGHGGRRGDPAGGHAVTATADPDRVHRARWPTARRRCSTIQP